MARKAKKSKKTKKEYPSGETTEAKLTEALPDDIKDAWERFREVALEFGEQRVYASHRSIMFSRKACHFFVRPTKTRLEVCFFVPKKIKHRLIKSTYQTTKVKVAHIVHITHRDQVEAPLTEWLEAAYAVQAAEKIPPGKSVIQKARLKKKTVTWSSLVTL